MNFFVKNLYHVFVNFWVISGPDLANILRHDPNQITSDPEHAYIENTVPVPVTICNGSTVSFTKPLLPVGVI